MNIILGNSLKCPVSVFLSLSTAECNIQTSPSPGIQVRHVYTPSTTKHFSPIKQSTTLTNKHRGNEVSSTPLLVHCKSSYFSFGKIFANLIFKTITMTVTIVYFFFSSTVYTSVGGTRRDGVLSQSNRTRLVCL